MALDERKQKSETWIFKPCFQFQQKIIERIPEFEYDYRTDACGYGFLRDLAHIFYQTPYFPDKWRNFIKPVD